MFWAVGILHQGHKLTDAQAGHSVVVLTNNANDAYIENVVKALFAVSGK